MESGHENIEDPVTSVIKETIYVAVGADVKDCKSTLLWALQNNGGKRICIIHVHPSAQRIPNDLCGVCPASLVDEKIVRDYRKTERQNMNGILEEYLSICHGHGVQAQGVWIEMGDVGKGIVELIFLNGIKDLIMGGALDKHYKEKMGLKSKKAKYVCKRAPLSCRIQFICSGHRINTREAKHLILRSTTWEPVMDNIESRASNYWRSKSLHNRYITKAGPLNHLRSDPDTPRRRQAQGELAVHTSKIKEVTFATQPIILDEARIQIEVEPISSYVPISKKAPVGCTVDTKATSTKDGTHEEGEVSTASNASMKGFFADAKMIANEMAAAIAAAAGDVSTKAPTPSPELVPAEKGALVKENIPEGPGLVTKGISAEVSTPSRGGASPTGAQTEEAPLTTPLVKSSSDPFVALSQVVKGGPSLVVTPSSIPMTIGAEVPEKQEVAGVLAEPTPTGSSLLHAEGAQSIVMEAGSSSTTAVDLMEEVTSFFARFEQGESNDLDPMDFWSIGPSYVNFHGYRVPKDCLDHLQAIYQDHGDFMQKFPLGRSAREHFLKLLGCVLNDIQHNFIDTVSVEKILQWRAVIQELIRVEFELGFVLDQLREIARVFFKRKVQPAIDAIDSKIESLKKETADLEAHRARLLSSVAALDDSQDNPLITDLM